MHAENDSEFELVLGNKQLLGLLFITVVLLGVFFALGYAMGRSTVPTPLVENRGTFEPAAQQTGSKPPTVEGVVAPPEPVVHSPTSTASPASAGTTAQPQQPPPTEATAGPTESGLLDPKPGDTFLQVGAVKRPEAEVLVEMLSRNGFKAGIAPAPIENMFRVLVGPVRTDVEQGKLKTDLEKAGFKPIPRRY